MSHDVIVLGIGAMGSATCRELARRGARVLGIEQFSLGHALGSSHGATRLIRQAYFEEPRYVPLLKRVYPVWDAISAEAGTTLFHRTGLLILAPPGGGASLIGVRRSAEQHGIAIQLVDESALGREFPQFRPGPGTTGIFEPGAGYLEVESCVIAMAQQAEAAGAELHFGETVAQWHADGTDVTVTTDRETYRAKRLVVTAGAWSSRLLAELGLPLRVLRVPQFWFPAPAETLQTIPCFAFDGPESFLYGFPPLPGLGMKMGDHHPKETLVADPSAVDRNVYPADLTRLTRCIRDFLPGVSPEPRAWSVCMYTMTPDEHFLLDRHPHHENVVFAAGFSGHGFKFAPVIGEILADLSEHGQTPFDIGFLRLRF